MHTHKWWNIFLTLAIGLALTMLLTLSLGSNTTAAQSSLSLVKIATTVDVTLTITVDNAYQVCQGDYDTVITCVGADADLHTAEALTLTNLNPQTDYIYIAAWSDISDYQGLLAQFTANGITVYSDDPAFQVYATQELWDWHAPPPTPISMTNKIVGANNSGAWVLPTVGSPNDDTSPLWDPISNIDAEARWVWFESSNCPGPNSPFHPACNHGEYLIFRLPVSRFYTSSVPSLTAISILALDNYITSTVYLEAFYNETMISLVQASIGHPEKTAILLVDRSGNTPDAIYKIHNGIMTNITTQWSGMMPEVDATNGVFLGNFVWWARTQYLATRTTLSVVGHGLYAPFESEDFTLNTQFFSAAPATFARALAERQAQQLPTALPMPMNVGGSPNWTDVNRGPGLGPNIFSTYDASEMLRIGSNNGTSPIDVADFSFMCFSASLEMFYPLREYTRMLTGGPNYNFFSPAALAAGFAALAPSQSAAEMATALIHAYHAALPPSEHPRVLVAVDTTHLNNLKHRLDELAYLLEKGLNNPAAATDYRTMIQAAYDTSLLYDTTGCPVQDWELCPPDAMTDVYSFMFQIQAQFPSIAYPEVHQAAGEVAEAAQAAVLTKLQQNDTPWFSPHAWDFTRGVGLSLYADFDGYLDKGGNTVLNGISYWYTSTISADNPHPYEFISPTLTISGTTWADVLHVYWVGTTITTELCLPAFPHILEEGDIAAVNVLFPPQTWTTFNTPITPTLVFSSVAPIHNPTLAITITQAGEVVYTDTLHLGYRVAGTYAVKANRSWTPATIDPFTLTFMVDSRNQISETNESNNFFTLVDKVRPSAACARPALSAQIVNGQQWFANPQIPVNLVQTAGLCSPVTQLVAQFYTYQPGQNPGTQIPIPWYTQTLSLNLPQNGYLLTLPANAPAGIYVAYLWPFSNSGGYGYPTEITFSYTPPATTLNSVEEHFYRFTVNAGEQVQLNCQAGQGSAQLYAWEPGNPVTALTMPCNGSLSLDPTQVGEYIVSIAGIAASSTYTLTATHGFVPLALHATATAVERVNRARPTFEEPLPALPKSYQVYLPLVIHAP